MFMPQEYGGPSQAGNMSNSYSPLANFLGTFIGQGNPTKAAMPYLNQIPGIAQQAYNPFIQQGQQVQPGLTNQYNQMAYNPVDTLRGFESQYTERPGYKYMFDKLNKAAGNTAAAGGFLGTDEDVRNRSEMHAGLLDNYMQQYLNNIFNIQGKGLSGLENITNRGYNASGNLADILGSTAAAQGAYGAYGRSYKNERNNNVWNALSNLIGIGVKGMTGGGF